MTGTIKPEIQQGRGTLPTGYEMKLINETGDDLSLEGMTTLAAIMNCVYAAEIAAYRVAETLDRMGAKGTFVQRKKQALNAARRHCQAMINNLETAFDSSFDHIIMREGSEYAGRRDAEFHALACEVLQVVLIFLSISEGAEYEKRMNIFKALRNFKVTADIDLPALLKYFRFEE